MNSKRDTARRYFLEGNYKEAFRICRSWKDTFGEETKHVQRAYEIMVGNQIYKEMGYSLEIELPLAKDVFKRMLLDILEKKK